ncbi:MAG: hypothetical protein DRJ03_20060 [Chloroflexi bacterium]|nr:MAG: hypothetical protein B6I35_15265 [Anaerolineaceae bacterium 4572_32.2]RLC75157.1 MAG: hypothetical protein DRI81_12580 [Chloroflexota bacterium]RLC81554.1 MAG: hypothetical protein DRJ03_20060 [Chloroflexota bacterium]
MITPKMLRYAVGVALLILLLAGCGGAPSAPTTAPTLIPPTDAPLSPTATAMPAPTAAAEGELQPLSAAECSGLADSMAQTLGMPYEIAQAPFDDHVNQKTGTGCQITITGTGLDFESVQVVLNGLRRTIQTQGWYEDFRYGGGGPTGELTGFRQAKKICRLLVGWEPSEDVECPADQPIFMCDVPPEKQIYSVVLNCVQDTGVAAAQSDLEPTRIQFAPGAISAHAEGSLDVGGADRYVLSVAAGQEMTLNLSPTLAGQPAEMSTIVTIWGADGSLLSSGYIDAAGWTTGFPSAQDYYIDVVSAAPGQIAYSMEVIVPPAPDISEGAAVMPRQVPPEFQPIMQALVLSGVPPMLPPEFPTGEGLPPVHPYVYLADDGEYDISLDFGADCQGAGACHHGSLAGKQVDSDEPVSTQHFEFDAERAKMVTLTRGIAGYFIESQCGANCDDAKVFWIYDGFQYMVGLKGGEQSAVLDLANAAIENSIQ